MVTWWLWAKRCSVEVSCWLHFYAVLFYQSLCLLTLPQCNPYVIGIHKLFLSYVVLNGSEGQWSLQSFAVFNWLTVSPAKYCVYCTLSLETRVSHLVTLFIIGIAMHFWRWALMSTLNNLCACHELCIKRRGISHNNIFLLSWLLCKIFK